MDLRLQTDLPYASTAVVGSHVSPGTAALPARPRLDAIDFVRGLVMIVMVLDHARDYLSGSGVNPRDVTDTALFLTRWITHFCAPVFIFLAGVSAFLYGQRVRSTAALARFLLTRGAWLVFIELTVIRFAWTFSLAYDFVFLQVIWVIGGSMIVLAALIHLPRNVVLVLSIGVIAAHDLLNGVEAGSFGPLSWLWTLLHAPGNLWLVPGVEIFALYPLIPWFAVMALGYALGPLFSSAERPHRRTLLWLGSATIAGFLVLRASNLYGDPAHWSVQGDALATVLSFINCEKYPPSLLYLAMTLGPCCLVLGAFRSATGVLSTAIVTIGRVPFLFYVVHIFVVHSMAVLLAWATGFDLAWLFQGMPPEDKPPGYGLPLGGVYVLWILAVLLLYPLCRWFSAVKARRKDWWLSYL